MIVRRLGEVENTRPPRAKEGIRWKAVLLGWLAAAVAGVGISLLIRFLYEQIAGPLSQSGSFLPTVAVISLASGFLAYLLGGFVAGRLVRKSCGLNGAVTAVVGLVLGVILALIITNFGDVFAEGVALPPANFGLSFKELLASLSLFLINLFGGYVGGKLGESSYPQIQRLD